MTQIFCYEVQCGNVYGQIDAETPEEAFRQLGGLTPEAKLTTLARWRRRPIPNTPELRKKYPHTWYYQTPESLVKS